MPCPFESKLGFATKETRDEFIELKNNESYNKEVLDANISFPETLQADPDTSKPLYFWQLFSILGRDPFVAIATEFYNRIFDPSIEDDEVFRGAFTNVTSKDMHIKAQSAYWIDAMGGGRVYFGGHSRLGFHHFSNHAEPVMNAYGAKRWMWHMKHAIQSVDFQQYHDPRILPCLVEFLRSKMWSYANEFGWDFDDSDFDISDFQYQKKSTEPFNSS